MNKIKKISSAIVATLALPLFSMAQTNVVSYGTTVAPASGARNLAGLINLVIYYLNLALVLLMAVAVVAFVFYVIKFFILKPDQDRKEANMYIMWSVVGFFVVFSLWGLVNILENTFGLQDSYGQGRWNNVRSLVPTGVSGGSNTGPGSSTK